MSDVFYEMSKVKIKPVVNYTVLQIFSISSLNFTLVVAFCTVAGNISHTFTPPTLGLFKCIVYLYLVPFVPVHLEGKSRNEGQCEYILLSESKQVLLNVCLFPQTQYTELRLK